MKTTKGKNTGPGGIVPRDYSLRNLFLFALAAFAAVTLLQALLGPSLVRRFHPLPPDEGPAWYYWQLEVTSTAARISYWAGYAAHQLVIFVLLFAGRRIRPQSGRASRFNALVLITNLAFVLLHLVQTHIWYDGLAQDVPIWTSQGSVIGMLILILVLEMPRRGLFFGKWKRVPKSLYAFIQRWHGIYISWAIVYTFWFHPMEGNWGLLSGFIYMYLLFIQLSLFNTRQHTRPGWVILMEAGVIIHSVLITIYKDNPIWPMFLFGFLAMFSFTQVFAFKKWPVVPVHAIAVYVVGAVFIYGFIRGVDHLYELTFIPVALYGGAIALWLVGRVIELFQTRLRAKPAGD